MTKPFLTEFSFFKGVTDGKLLFSSEISEKNSVSKLKIENFKVVNAPGMIKLLSLADLSGLADLAEGEGISFDSLEINMKKSNQVLEIKRNISFRAKYFSFDGGISEHCSDKLKGYFSTS